MRLRRKPRIEPRPPTSLGDRAANLETLSSEDFDLLVVGGGITGAGIAFDAAARGLRVALIDRSDFASGTSSRSTKLIHGGLRYLSQFRFRLTREALSERYLLLRRLAPNLVRWLPFVFPVYDSRIETLRLSAGLWIYDLLAGLRRTPRHNKLPPERALAEVPMLNPEGLRAAFRYYDAQTDDARLVLEALKSAVAWGAVVASHVSAMDFARFQGEVVGVEARDELGGADFTISARQTVLATGVWLDELAGKAAPNNESRLQPSKGVHLVLPPGRFSTKNAIVAPTPDRRLMFVVPWLQGTLIGTTDTYYEGQLDQPRASSEDVRYLVDLTNEVFPAAKVGFDEIISVQAGLRPLIASDKLRSTSDISRSERIFDLCPGVIGIAGGKLTTYRRVASKVVDQTVKRLHRSGILRKRPKSPTRGLPLSSALGRPGAWGFESDLAGEAPLATAVHLYQTYGSWWEQVWEIAAADPQLAEPIEPGLPYVGAEVVNAVRNEMAMRLVDVLARRTHVVLFAKDQGRAAARRVVSIMASELGWSHAEIQAELAAFDAEVMQFDPGAVLGEGAVSAAGLRL